MTELLSHQLGWGMLLWPALQACHPLCCHLRNVLLKTIPIASIIAAGEESGRESQGKSSPMLHIKHTGINPNAKGNSTSITFLSSCLCYCHIHFRSSKMHNNPMRPQVLGSHRKSESKRESRSHTPGLWLWCACFILNPAAPSLWFCLLSIKTFFFASSDLGFTLSSLTPCALILFHQRYTVCVSVLQCYVQLLCDSLSCPDCSISSLTSLLLLSPWAPDLLCLTPIWGGTWNKSFFDANLLALGGVSAHFTATVARPKPRLLSLRESAASNSPRKPAGRGQLGGQWDSAGNAWSKNDRWGVRMGDDLIGRKTEEASSILVCLK